MKKLIRILKRKPPKKRSQNKIRKQPVRKSVLATRLRAFGKVTLRVSLRVCIFCIGVGISIAAAYFLRTPISEILIESAGVQQFAHASNSAISAALLKLSICGGLIFAVPFFVYQLLRVVQQRSKKKIPWFAFKRSIISGLLTFSTVIIGCIIGLPLVADSRLAQSAITFAAASEQPTTDIYLLFAITFLLCLVLLVHVPFIILSIDKIKRLRVRTLFHIQRYVIVVALLVGALTNQSTHIKDQLLISAPPILATQLGIVLVWAAHRRGRRPKKILELMRKDEETRSARLANFQKAHEHWLRTIVSTMSAPAHEQETPEVANTQPQPNTIITPHIPIVFPEAPNPDIPSPMPSPSITPGAAKPTSVAIPVIVPEPAYAPKPDQPSPPTYRSITVTFQD